MSKALSREGGCVRALSYFPRPLCTVVRHGRSLTSRPTPCLAQVLGKNGVHAHSASSACRECFAHSTDFPVVVVACPPVAGQHCLGSVRSLRTDSCSGQPCGRPERLSPSAPTADRDCCGRLARRPIGNVHPVVVCSAVADRLTSGYRWLGPVGLSQVGAWPERAGSLDQPIVSLNTGYQPYSLSLRCVIIEIIDCQILQAAMAKRRLRLRSAFRRNAQDLVQCHRQRQRLVLQGRMGRFLRR